MSQVRSLADTAGPRPAEGPPSPPAEQHRAARSTGLDFVAPVALYSLAFCVLTWPAMLSFGTHFFADQGDGLQNVWNLWWTRKAVVELHQSPWFTTWLHHPGGTTLLGHTLNAFNGLIGIPLSLFFSPIEVHNVVVLLGFVGAGWGTFLLARDAIGSWWGSAVAGFAFTFTGYHFAHAEGHLQLVSVEWLPIFVLCWIRLLRAPTLRRALVAAGMLGLVILCDYYYFLYCVGVSLVLAAWQTWQRRDPLLLCRRPYAAPIATFLVAAASTSGLLAGALLYRSSVDPFVIGRHDPAQYSTDVLAPFVPGGHSAWHSLTAWYWRDLPGNIHESSVYLGLTVLALATLGFARRRALAFSAAPLWAVLAVGFFTLSLGPALQWRGDPVSGPWMPYRWLEAIFPPLQMSGCPTRMMVVVALSVSLLAGAGFAAVARRRPGTRVVGALLMIALAADLWPRPLTLSRPEVPGWVDVLRVQQGNAGLLDLSGTPEPLALYFQTLHGKPMASGYVSRYSRSVFEASQRLARDVNLGRFVRLRDEDGLRYLLTDGSESRRAGVLYEGAGVRLYDLTITF